MLHREGHDGGTSRDEGLLVGEADVLTGLDGGDGGGEGRHSPTMPVTVESTSGCLATSTMPSGPKRISGLVPVHVLDHLLERIHVGTVRDGHHLGLELLDLLGHHVEVAAGGERHDLELVGVLLRDVQSLRADGAGGTEEGDLLDVPVAEEGHVVGHGDAAGPARAIAGTADGGGWADGSDDRLGTSRAGKVDKEGSNRFPVTHLVVGVRASSLGDGGALLRATGPEGGRGGDGNRGSDGGRHLGFGGSGRARNPNRREKISSWISATANSASHRQMGVKWVRFARVPG